MNPQRMLKRLAAAEGYLLLSMPKQAMSELRQIANPGVLQPIAQLFWGEALQAESRYDEAISTLSCAVKQVPPVLAGRALRALSHCYQETGQPDLAKQTAEEADRQPNGVLTIMVAPAASGGWIRSSNSSEDPPRPDTPPSA